MVIRQMLKIRLPALGYQLATILVTILYSSFGVVSAQAQFIDQVCAARQLLEAGSENDYTDPTILADVQGTPCSVKNSGTYNAVLTCTDVYHDEQSAAADFLRQKALFWHCFGAVRFYASTEVTDSQSGIKRMTANSEVLTDESWFSIAYDLTPRKDGTYLSDFAIHAPP